MKPLIKWPGGKAAELSRFDRMFPSSYDRYIEPFLGGGAVYFHLDPEKALVNDTSWQLMDLYRLLQARDAQLQHLLLLYCDTFQALQEICGEKSEEIRALFHLYETACVEDLKLDRLQIHQHLVIEIAADPRVLSELILSREEYLLCMLRTVEEKMKRTLVNHRRKPFSDEDLQKNLLTGFTSGFYLYFRDLYNEIALRKRECSRAFAAANYYFIREYCYGSMFRYNAKGEFNIPYGGMSYNQKDLGAKIRHMFSEEVTSLLRRTDLFCTDFEVFLDRVKPAENDFMFLDPPYDTDFSEYEGKTFAHEDHMRLAECLDRTQAMFLMVIKNTEFISKLYRGKFRRFAFDNRYSYNVRSRNERKAEHLIITNFSGEELPWDLEEA